MRGLSRWSTLLPLKQHTKKGLEIIVDKKWNISTYWTHFNSEYDLLTTTFKLQSQSTIHFCMP